MQFEATTCKRQATELRDEIIVEFVEAFRALARNPGIGHKREDLAESRPILFWPLRDYLIVYRPHTRPVEIVVVARGSRDFAKIIKRRNL